jgi:hypothetical protein
VYLNTVEGPGAGDDFTESLANDHLAVAQVMLPGHESICDTWDLKPTQHSESASGTVHAAPSVCCCPILVLHNDASQATTLAA